MSLRLSHRLFVGIRPGYAGRIERLSTKLSRYRIEDAIDWKARVEDWLSNFEGLTDQETALSMLERLRVISQDECVDGSKALFERIEEELLVPRARLHHYAHETSGALLLRILEKKLKVRRFTLLRPHQFAKLGAVEKLRAGDAVVVWDTFLGTGGQLRDQIQDYEPLFAPLRPDVGPLYFAYLAGHPPSLAPPPEIRVHRWIEDVPVISDVERDLCSRYAQAAGQTATNQRHETGALITFPDNPPNNVPLVLRARRSDTWFTLLDREDTPTP